MSQQTAAAKRAARELKSRAKRREKHHRFAAVAQDLAWKRKNNVSWLEGLGRAQKKAEKAMNEQHKQALESFRSKAAMPEPTPKGLVGRVKSFFQRRGR